MDSRSRFTFSLGGALPNRPLIVFMKRWFASRSRSWPRVWDIVNIHIIFYLVYGIKVSLTITGEILIGANSFLS